MAPKKKERKKKLRRDKTNGWKYDERGGTRGKRYGVLWTFNKAHAKLLARCLRFHCAVFACVETTDAMNVLRCVEWRAGGHGGRFVEFLDETQEWIMARCKQSSTRPPNCNFLCLILVTEWKKFNEYIYIYFLHSSPFYFFEKLLLIPSFSFFSLFPIFGKADCFQGLNYRCSKKISIFLLVRSIIFIQLQFSSCLNYFRIIQPQIYLFIHFSFLNFIDFITSIISMHFFFAQNLLRFHLSSRH